jgi:hypothetical protein
MKKVSSTSNTGIGCCGAYCMTCKALSPGACKGCTIGYGNGHRDISKAKCPIKVCCFRQREHETCADCPDYPCRLIAAHFSKKGWKYRQTRRQLKFIREHGYKNFLKIAKTWKDCRGRLSTASVR